MRALAITSTLLAMLIVGAQAWWCTPHMVIAEIARQNLNDGVEDKVNTYFGFLHQFFSQSENMVSGACWADDLKSSKLETMASWHFINQPYDPTGFPISQWPIQEENVQTTINQFEETVKKADSNEWITAFAVANLVHFYGDIHQPLHATELFNEVYPKGDKGGNLIKVVVPWDSNPFALHFVWDSVAGQYLNSPNRPLNNEDFTYIKSLAAQYQANFSVPDAEKKVWNSTVMALESYEWAVQYAYANNTIQAGDVLTQEYLANVMTVSGFRIATAGYRLASELNFLFGKRATGHEMLARVASAKREYKDAIKSIRRPVNKN